MNYHYTKIDDLTLNDSQLYFRTPLTTVFTRATTFSDKYLYYHCPPTIENKPDPDIKTLGKFLKVSRQSTGSMYDDYDYSVYEFELGIVKCKPDGRTDGEIYLVGIPDSDEGMTLIDNMSYKGWPVFYTPMNI
jgi:hypothetical protein